MPLKKEEPSISVIMPVYNMGSFVGEAIRSILKQTFAGFELIIIDDASTDDSLKHIYSFRDSRIRVIEVPANKGNFPARNKGIEMARGRYIAVMDADDIAFAERLQKQYDYLENNPEVQAVGSDALVLPSNLRRGTPLFTEAIRLSLLDNSYVLHPSLMIRAVVMRRLQGYREQYRYAGDYDLLCRLALVGAINCLPELLMYYRQHPGQITGRHRAEQIAFADEIRQNYQMAQSLPRTKSATCHSA